MGASWSNTWPPGSPTLESTTAPGVARPGSGSSFPGDVKRRPFTRPRRPRRTAARRPRRNVRLMRARLAPASLTRSPPRVATMLADEGIVPVRGVRPSGPRLVFELFSCDRSDRTPRTKLFWFVLGRAARGDERRLSPLAGEGGRGTPRRLRGPQRQPIAADGPAFFENSPSGNSGPRS